MASPARVDRGGDAAFIETVHVVGEAGPDLEAPVRREILHPGHAVRGVAAGDDAIESTVVDVMAAASARADFEIVVRIALVVPAQLPAVAEAARAHAGDVQH